MTYTHCSVMPDQVIEALNVSSGWYVDATVGAGGHSQLILEKGGRVIGIDRDESALTLTAARLKDRPIVLKHGNFGDLSSIVRSVTSEPIAGILFDFGVSSMQFDQKDRGFSFMTDAPLDMRMDRTQTRTAADIINHAREEELYALLTTLAQEKHARAISQAIVSARQIKPIETTGELVNIINSRYHGPKTHLHPATLTFQALRIAVNEELKNIKKALPQAIRLLKNGGHVVTISFHEGEDRLVKQWMKESYQRGKGIILTRHPIKPERNEINNNPRARSARLRSFEKRYA